MKPLLVRINNRTAANPDYIMMVGFNAQTLKTAVFLEGGVAIESDKTFDETIASIDAAKRDL